MVDTNKYNTFCVDHFCEQYFLAGVYITHTFAGPTGPDPGPGPHGPTWMVSLEFRFKSLVL